MKSYLTGGSRIRDVYSAPVLDALAADLRTGGIPTVNPLPAFQSATASRTRLYWRDDTHWNDAGIHLAAEKVTATRLLHYTFSGVFLLLYYETPVFERTLGVCFGNNVGIFPLFEDCPVV